MLNMLRKDGSDHARRDDDPEVDHQMIGELGKVQPDELTNLPSHAGYCALRFKLLAAMGVTNNRQSRENARKLEEARTTLIRYFVGGIAVIAVIELFGKDKGLDLLKLIGSLL